MTLETLEYNKDLEGYRTDQGLKAWSVCQISLEHKDRYIIKTSERNMLDFLRLRRQLNHVLKK